MAKIIDTRNSGGLLIIFGDAMAIPTSNAANVAVTEPMIAGVVRYNPDIDSPQFMSNTTASWTSFGANAALASSISLLNPIVTIFADLPATPVAGQRAFITDSNTVATGNFGANATGSGPYQVPVYFDGTANASVWRIG